MDPDAVVAVVVVLRGGAVVARWPVPRTGCSVDLGHVDAVARLVVAARRLGCAARVELLDEELIELVDLVGLRREVLRETEGCEQPALHLQEAVVPDDPLG